MKIIVDDRAKLDIREVNIEVINPKLSYLFIETEAKYYDHSFGYQLSNLDSCYERRYLHLYRYRSNGGTCIQSSTIEMIPENKKEKRLLHRDFLLAMQRYCIGFYLLDDGNWHPDKNKEKILWRKDGYQG